jgi:hypothetical protein
MATGAPAIPKEPKNRRQRCSLLIETASKSLQALHQGSATRILVDTSPDMRNPVAGGWRDRQSWTVSYIPTPMLINCMASMIYGRSYIASRAMVPAFHQSCDRYGDLGALQLYLRNAAGVGVSAT